MAKQEADERFATFEIRVRNLINNVVNSGLSTDEIINDVLSKKVKNENLREALTTRPDIKITEMRSLAKIYEDKEHYQRVAGNENVCNIQKTSYANAVKFNRNNVERGVQKLHKSNFPTNNNWSYGKARVDVPTFWDIPSDRMTHSVIAEDRTQMRRLGPAVSMKHIAKCYYNQSKGIS